MPPSNQRPQEVQTRVLAYGPAHHRKTWWLLAAAEAGFNVVVFNTDNNLGIINHLSEEARKRIYVIDIVDDIDDSHAEKFCSRFFKGQGFLWDEVTKTNQLILKTANKEHSFVKIEPGKLNYNTIIGMDSFTAYVESLKKRYSNETKVDLSNKVVIDSNWKDYRWTGMMADNMLAVLKHFKCHFVFTAHETLFEKKDKDDQEKILISRIQPVSTSANQSMRIAKYFNDIIHFSMVGDEVWLDTRPSSNRDGGCVNFKLGKFRWSDCQFGKYIKSTGEPLSGFTFYGPGELPVDVEVKAPVAVVQGTISNMEAPKKVSLASLMNKG